MNEVEQNRRLQLVALSIVTAGLLVLLWSFVILPQRQAVVNAQSELSWKQSARLRIQDNRHLVARIQTDLQDAQVRINEVEAKMAQGDPYLWAINIFRTLEMRHGVEFTEVEKPRAYDLDFYPKVPYRAALFTVVGTGFYADWGITLDEFEREYPMCRLQRLELAPASGANGDPADAEKLTLKLEFIALIKPESAVH